MINFEKKAILGMIHLAGPDAIDKAMEEIKIYEEEGLSGIIVENYHGGIEDVIKVLERLSMSPTTMSVGINILPNEYEAAFALCKRFPFIEFIQLDYVAGEYKGVNHDYEVYLDNYTHITTKVYGGVWPKYYTPKEGSNLEADLINGIYSCDAIVVTGAGTGMETPLEKIKYFKEIIDKNRTLKVNETPLIIGAGLTPLNVRESLQFADGAIVGSAFKPNGRTHQMVDRGLVRVFMDEVKKI